MYDRAIYTSTLAYMMKCQPMWANHLIVFIHSIVDAKVEVTNETLFKDVLQDINDYGYSMFPQRKS